MSWNVNKEGGFSLQVNPSKLMSIQRKLEAMLARDLELKQMAQRAFVTYVKSVFLMKDKSVFDVQQIDMNALARSLGLAIPPRVRFLQKRLKGSGAGEGKPAAQPAAASGEKWRQEDLEIPYKLGVEEEEKDDEEEDDNEEGSESDDDILKLKRKDHALAGDEESNDEDLEAGEKKKKIKILTKEKVAKRILAKKLKANQKVVFDEEGNVSAVVLVLLRN